MARRKITAEGEDIHSLIANIKDTPAVLAALGYLTTWAFDSYDEVVLRVYPLGKEITASYTAKDKSFFMVAMWSETERKFRFHS